jgi:hypothetical protein
MRHLITLGCLVAALACYLMSYELCAGLLFVAGGVLEFTFWRRIGLGPKKRSAPGETATR